MIKYFAKAFHITNENIILTTPLVLFILLFGIYLGIASRMPYNIFTEALLLITVLSMFAAFFAGWLFMTKKAVDIDKEKFNDEEEKAKASFFLIKYFTAGVGEYFFSFVGAILFYTILLGGIYFVLHLIGIKMIGMTFMDLNKTFANPIIANKTLSTMNQAQIIKISEYLMIACTFIVSFYFLTMFWFVQIVEKIKNPFIALFSSIKFIFKNFLNSIILFIYMFLINFAVYLLGNLMPKNAIVQLFAMLISFYSIVYVVVLLFLYYDRTVNPEIEITTTEE